MKNKCVEEGDVVNENCKKYVPHKAYAYAAFAKKTGPSNKIDNSTWRICTFSVLYYFTFKCEYVELHVNEFLGYLYVQQAKHVCVRTNETI